MEKFNPDIHNRRSIRLKGYDYSQAGLYFVTICCQNRNHLFGDIIDGQMQLNDAGEMIEKIGHEIPNYFLNINLHEYKTMPNHIHGIIEIVGADSISVPPISVPNRAEMDSAPTSSVGLPQIVQSFKRHTTIQYIKMVKQNILPVFDKRIWQRNYWEHIIRNEKSFNELPRRKRRGISFCNRIFILFFYFRPKGRGIIPKAAQ